MMDLNKRKEELLKELAEIEAQEKRKLWVPELMESYWSIGHGGHVEVYTFGGDAFDKGCIERHNIYRTKELAEAQSKRISAFNELNRIADEFGRGRFELYYGLLGKLDAYRMEGNTYSTGLNIFTEESARIAIEIMSDNCKAFIKGEL